MKTMIILSEKEKKKHRAEFFALPGTDHGRTISFNPYCQQIELEYQPNQIVAKEELAQWHQWAYNRGYLVRIHYVKGYGYKHANESNTSLL